MPYIHLSTMSANTSVASEMVDAGFNSTEDGNAENKTDLLHTGNNSQQVMNISEIILNTNVSNMLETHDNGKWNATNILDSGNVARNFQTKNISAIFGPGNDSFTFGNSSWLFNNTLLNSTSVEEQSLLTREIRLIKVIVLGVVVFVLLISAGKLVLKTFSRYGGSKRYDTDC